MLLPYEHGAPRGDVHLPPAWALETAGVGIRAEAIRHMPLTVLVEEGERDLLLEWPREQLVYGATHDHKEETHVGALSEAVSIQIDSGTHLVPVTGSVEGGGVEGQGDAFNCLLAPAFKFIHLPQKDPIVRRPLQQLYPQLLVQAAAQGAIHAMLQLYEARGEGFNALGGDGSDVGAQTRRGGDGGQDGPVRCDTGGGVHGSNTPAHSRAKREHGVGGAEFPGPVSRRHGVACGSSLKLDVVQLTSQVGHVAVDAYRLLLEVVNLVVVPVHGSFAPLIQKLYSLLHGVLEAFQGSCA